MKKENYSLVFSIILAPAPALSLTLSLLLSFFLTLNVDK